MLICGTRAACGRDITAWTAAAWDGMNIVRSAEQLSDSETVVMCVSQRPSLTQLKAFNPS
jgi:hypothetical protein